MLALAGPANRQGRIAADVIAGRDAQFRGVQGTAIVGLFGGALAWTGVSEKTLKRLGDDDYEKVYLFPNSHAGYYPDALPIAMKVIFRKSDGRLLGAQAVGRDGWTSASTRWPWRSSWAARSTTWKRPSSATRPSSAAPSRRPTSPAWSPATCWAATCPSRTGATWTASSCWTCVTRRNSPRRQLPGVVNIPVDQLRARLDELPRDREIAVICRSGQRAYYATRILLQNGFKRSRHVRRHALPRDLRGGVTRAVSASQGWVMR